MQVAAESGHTRTGAALFLGVVLGVATLVAIFSAAGALPAGSQATAGPKGLSSFDSYSQLQEYVAANARSAQQYVSHGIWFGETGMGIGAPLALTGSVATTMTEAVALSPVAQFTGTNVQVEGVDEPDRVKTDGTHLFVSSGGQVTIIDAYPPNSTSVASVISLPNSSVVGLEIAQSRLLVIDQKSSYHPYPIYAPWGRGVTYGSGVPDSIALLLYNTSTISSPSLIANVSIAGDYVAARLADGCLYAVIQQPSYTFADGGNATGVLPTMTDDGSETILPPTSVYYAPGDSQVSFYTMIESVDMLTGSKSVISVLTGPSATVYVSTSNIYIVYTNYPDLFSSHGIPGDVYTGGTVSMSEIQQAQNSTILRASYSGGDVTVEAAGAVPGSVLNQFSLDEYDGYFRVATGRFAVVGGALTRSDDVYVLDLSMNQVSALRDIAPGENIYAVRFVGETGYVVTFEQIDPLFVISFKDMAHPVIQSALKVSGYSDYLHPLPGGYLIGVGKDAVPSSMANVAYYTGLKLSLFRAFDNGTSIQVSKLVIGDRGTDSPVLTDHLAFTFDPTRNVTVIPLTLYVVSGNQTTCSGCPPPYGDPVWQGVYVVRVTPTGFNLLARVSQYPPGLNFGDSPNNSLQIDRSVIIGNSLYTVSQSEVMVSDMQTFTTTATIQLLA